MARPRTSSIVCGRTWGCPTESGAAVRYGGPGWRTIGGSSTRRFGACQVRLRRAPDSERRGRRLSQVNRSSHRGVGPRGAAIVSSRRGVVVSRVRDAVSPVSDGNGRKAVARPQWSGSRWAVDECSVQRRSPKAKRDAKGEISRHMPEGRVYKPTVDQLALTRLLDFRLLRASALPCFGTLERALRFLSGAHEGDVYPPSP